MVNARALLASCAEAWSAERVPEAGQPSPHLKYREAGAGSWKGGRVCGHGAGASCLLQYRQSHCPEGKTEAHGGLSSTVITVLGSDTKAHALLFFLKKKKFPLSTLTPTYVSTFYSNPNKFHSPYKMVGPGDGGDSTPLPARASHVPSTRRWWCAVSSQWKDHFWLLVSDCSQLGLVNDIDVDLEKNVRIKFSFKCTRELVVKGLWLRQLL